MKKGKTCYKCGARATSREHVPPLCLFPEEKDIGVQGFRMNLITVPSCDEHNSHKSSDDEFLMACLAGVVGNNHIGFFHTKTKVKRTLETKSKDFIQKVMKNPKELFFQAPSGTIYPLLQGSPDFERLVNCFQHIACGLFFKEYRKVFVGECIVVMGFLKYHEENQNKFVTLCKKAFELNSSTWPIKGANPQVFKYQFGVPDTLGLIPLKLTFYEGTEVFISFKDKSIPTPYNIAMDFIWGGIKTTVSLGNGEEIVFN